MLYDRNPCLALLEVLYTEQLLLSFQQPYEGKTYLCFRDEKTEAEEILLLPEPHGVISTAGT